MDSSVTCKTEFFYKSINIESKLLIIFAFLPPKHVVLNIVFSYSSWLWSHRVYHHGRDWQTLLVKKGTNRNKYSHSYQKLVPRLESSNLSSFYSLSIKILVPPLLLSEMGHSSLKQLIKISNNKMSQFSGEFTQASGCGVHFYKNVQLMAWKAAAGKEDCMERRWKKTHFEKTQVAEPFLWVMLLLG